METYREMTKPSAEQPTMFQVHGSTEFISQPSITCNSSLILVLTAIKAVTDKHNTTENQMNKKNLTEVNNYKNVNIKTKTKNKEKWQQSDLHSSRPWEKEDCQWQKLWCAHKSKR